MTMLSMLFAFSLLLVTPPMLAGRDLNYSDEPVHIAVDYGRTKLSTVLISGSVICMTCGSLKKSTPTTTDGEPVSGALVAFSCYIGRKTSITSWVEAKTREGGEFLIDLPLQFHAIPNLEKRCLVEVIGLPKSCLCRHSFTGKRVGLKLSLESNGIRVYVADIVHLMPKPSQICISGQVYENVSGLAANS